MESSTKGAIVVGVTAIILVALAIYLPQDKCEPCLDSLNWTGFCEDNCECTKMTWYDIKKNITEGNTTRQVDALRFQCVEAVKR